MLFKRFADVDAFPLCVKTKDVDEFVQTVYNISGSFGGINLEDIAAPRCFEIERRLKEMCDIPVFHDDQHGTAIIALAGLTNALKVVGKKKEEVRVVFSGAGSAAISITCLLYTSANSSPCASSTPSLWRGTLPCWRRSIPGCLYTAGHGRGRNCWWCATLRCV